jgi:vesicle transport through interaction with t-SNAREs protein 1
MKLRRLYVHVLALRSMSHHQVAQMEVELPSMPVSIRQNYQGKLAASKAGLDKVKKTLVSYPAVDRRS